MFLGKKGDYNVDVAKELKTPESKLITLNINSKRGYKINLICEDSVEVIQCRRFL